MKMQKLCNVFDTLNINLFISTHTTSAIGIMPVMTEMIIRLRAFLEYRFVAASSPLSDAEFAYVLNTTTTAV